MHHVTTSTPSLYREGDTWLHISLLGDFWCDSRTADYSALLISLRILIWQQ